MPLLRTLRNTQQTAGRAAAGGAASNPAVAPQSPDGGGAGALGAISGLLSTLSPPSSPTIDRTSPPELTADGPPTRGGVAQSTQRAAERTQAPTQALGSPDTGSGDISRGGGTAGATQNAARTQASPSVPTAPSPVSAGGGDGVPSVFQPLPQPPGLALGVPGGGPPEGVFPPAPTLGGGPAPTLGGGPAGTPLAGGAGGLLGGGLRTPSTQAPSPDISPLLLTLLQLLQR